MVHTLEEGELEIFCWSNTYVGSKKYKETIKKVYLSDSEKTDILLQRFDSETGERVFWARYGQRDTPVFDDYLKKLVEAEKQASKLNRLEEAKA